MKYPSMNITEIKLGKITNVKFGISDELLGLHLTFGGQSWAVCATVANLDYESVETKDKADEVARNEGYAHTIRYISKLFKDAKVTSVEQLKNIPVEVTFEFSTLKSWRVLTEVL